MSHSNFWFIVKQPEYMVHTTNFYKSADAIYLAAVDKKLDAATEAYASMAKNCVQCHRLVRAEQHKQAVQAVPISPPGGLVGPDP